MRVHFIFRRNANETVVFDVEVGSAQIPRIHELCFDCRVINRRAIFSSGLRLLFEQQFAGAARCFDDRLDERNAEFPFFELEDAVNGAAGRGGDSVL